MSYSSLFRDLERSVIGYDQFFSRIEEQARRSYQSFPPYSIRKDGETKYVIELAVAGFGKQDIEIELRKSKKISNVLSMYEELINSLKM
jgi:HSP20 family molecular chaperone IbpA